MKAVINLLTLLATLNVLLHRVSEKSSQNCFCHNFVKFLLTLITFGMLMAKTTKLCKVHSFSTSPNLCSYFSGAFKKLFVQIHVCNLLLHECMII